MREVDEDFLLTVASSHQQITEVNVWAGGEIIAAGIPVTSGGIDFDSDADMTRISRGITVVSEDNSLTPLTTSAPLAPYGPRLEVRAGAVVAGERRMVRLGFLRISSSEPSEQYYRDGANVLRRSASVISVEADDLLQIISDAAFLNPEQPPAGAHCHSEIRRLVGTLLPCNDFAGVPDPAVPSTIKYDDGQGGRLKAVQALAAACDATCRATDDGYLTLVPRARSAEPVLTLRTAGTPDGRSGQIIQLKRKMTRDQVYNAVIARGEAEGDAAPVQGIAYDTVTPARWGGDFGVKPYTFNSPLITTQAQADSAAITRLNNLIAGRDYEITTTVVPNPAVELDDCVRLVTPFEEFIGVVRSYSYPLVPGGLMSVTLSVLVKDVAMVTTALPSNVDE